MKIHHLRNATMVIESGNHHILVDPMLSDKDRLPPFARWRHRSRPNPTVSLPDNARSVLERATHCLITHCRTFGIKALQHTDHLDGPGEFFLRNRNIPVVCRRQDAAYLRRYGLNVQTTLDYGEPQPLCGGAITSIPACHGHGWIRYLMANGAGFFLALTGEPSIYISGDTVLTPAVDHALTTLKPDIAVVAAGGASLDVGGAILMPLAEILDFVRAAPGKVVANHLEALNHCPTSRAQLKRALADNGLDLQVAIPEDGETLVFAPVNDRSKTPPLAAPQPADHQRTSRGS